MSENQTNPAPAAPPAKGPATILLAVIALLLVGVLGLVVMMFLNQKKMAANPAAAAAAPAAEGKTEGKSEGGEGHEGAAPGKAAPGAGPTVRLADFVVHLRNPEADRYARISFEIEVGNDKDKEALTARSAQVRDAFIAYLSDRTVEELRGSAGLATIKAALMKEAMELAPDGHIRSLYITDFVVQ